MLYDLTDINGRSVVYAYLTSIGAFRGPQIEHVMKEANETGSVRSQGSDGIWRAPMS